MNNKTLILKRVILTVLTVSAIGFIFYNSSLNADDSTVQSTGVLEFINNLLSSLNIDIALGDKLVRKCAHFVEYFLLGTLLYFTVESYAEKFKYRIVVTCGVGFVTACIDEFIQLFSQGRSAQFSDVILDFIGVCTAVFILYLIFKCASKRKTDKEVLF